VAGDLARGDFGLAALPGREVEARAAIDKGLAYALDVSARHVHVLAGKTTERGAEAAFVENLGYAAERGKDYGIGILIEPLSEATQPGYFLQRVDEAARLIGRIGQPNVGILFDCFHVQTTHGELLPLLRDHLDLIGHIQIASVPDRSEPDHGEVEYRDLVAAVESLGYDGHIGAEYLPATTTTEGLAWMDSYRSR
jgi:hydroxypyruvate isomerase